MTDAAAGTCVFWDCAASCRRVIAARITLPRRHRLGACGVRRFYPHDRLKKNDRVMFETRTGYQSTIRMRVAWNVVPGA